MKIPANVRTNIDRYIKNHIDISDLIKDYEVSGEDFSGAIITKFDRPGEDLSGMILTGATIGTPNSITNWNRVNAKGCLFKRCQFVGTLLAKCANFKGTTWDEAFAPYVDYRFANMEGCTFCETVFTVSTKKSYGAKFDTLFFKDLAKHWNLKIEVEEKIKENDNN